MTALAEGGPHVALIGGEEDGALVVATDREELRLEPARRTDGGLDPEGDAAEALVLPAIQWADAEMSARPALYRAVDELGGLAEDEMGGGVGVDGVVLADRIEAGRVGAQSQGGEAVGAKVVMARDIGDGEGSGLVAVTRFYTSYIPELDGS